MLSETEITITKEDAENFKRLDTLLASRLPDLSRNLIKKLFEQGHFKSEHKLELKKLPAPGVRILFDPPPPAPSEIKAQNIKLDILYEDEHLIIINKQAGLVVHPAPGNPDGTLVNAILYHCKDLKGIGNEMRPGIVHRLDKGTSGIMVVAKDALTHEGLVNLFSKHDIKRKYQAIVLGSKLPEEQTIKAPIGRSPHNRLKMACNVKNAKDAVTHMKVEQVFKYFSHLELTLETGRTHQIRVHLSELMNAPILNDHTYGKIKQERSLMSSDLKSLIYEYDYPFLHAKLLGFVHPITKKKLLFEQTPPKIFQRALNCLETSL